MSGAGLPTLSAEEYEALEAVKQFIRDAWCVDGEVTHHWGSITVDNYFELTDSKRGRMRTAILPMPTEQGDK